MEGDIMIRELRKLFNITGMLRRFIILTLLRCPFDALYTAVQALFLKHAFDAVNNAQTSSLFITCILFGVGNIILFLYNGNVWTVYTAFVTRWTAVLRRKLFRHIGSLSLRQIEMRTVGEWITRLNSDLHAATAMLNQPIHIPHAVVSLVNAVVSSVILASADMMMFSLVILFAVPHMLISRLIVAKPMTRLATDVQEAAAENASDMNAIIVCAAEALIYDAQSFLLRRFEESSLNIRRKSMRLQHRRALVNSLIPLMGMSGYLAALLVGGSRIAGGAMTFGSLTAVLQSRGRMLVSLMMFINSMINIKTALAGVRRVCDTMDIRPEDRDVA